jgi:hypothetical protein
MTQGSILLRCVIYCRQRESMNREKLAKVVEEVLDSFRA